MNIAFHALPTDVVAHIRKSGTSIDGRPVETALSDGVGVPCRHCLKMVPTGAPYLILGHRPFVSDNPYAETGPVFLCAAECARAQPNSDVPAILESATYIVRGYGADERIVYGTGGVVPTPEIPARAKALLRREDVAFVDIRSAANNCFQCRVWPAPS